MRDDAVLGRAAQRSSHALDLVTQFAIVFSLRPQKGPLALFYQMFEFCRDPSGFSSEWSVKIKEL